jgi:predicted lipoprotein with Yx(FWY)xxD motif
MIFYSTESWARQGVPGYWYFPDYASETNGDFVVGQWTDISQSPPA